MRKGEKLQDFVSGFLQGETVTGRPCGIMRLDADSFLFTDDFGGIIYYVRKKAAATKVVAAPEARENLSENTESTNTNQPETAAKSKNCFGVAVILLGICLRVIFSR